MRTGTMQGSDRMVAKSLKITRATVSMVVSSTAGVSTYAMLALQTISGAGQAVALGLVFAFVAIISSAVATDLLERSGQSLTTLRTLGATKGVVGRSVLSRLVLFGVAGAAVGTVIGIGLAAGLSGFAATGGVVGAALSGVELLLVTLAAIFVGAYVGTGRAWRS